MHKYMYAHSSIYMSKHTQIQIDTSFTFCIFGSFGIHATDTNVIFGTPHRDTDTHSLTHIDTHMYRHTQIHTHTHTHVQAHIDTDTHRHMHTLRHTQTPAHTEMHTVMH